MKSADGIGLFADGCSVQLRQSRWVLGKCARARHSQQGFEKAFREVPDSGVNPQCY
jgi:hypothetical protein